METIEFTAGGGQIPPHKYVIIYNPHISAYINRLMGKKESGGRLNRKERNALKMHFRRMLIGYWTQESVSFNQEGI